MRFMRVSVSSVAEGNAPCSYREGRRVVPRGGATAMGWASGYIDRLRRGEVVQSRPRGDSMRGKIESGQLCTIEPVDPWTLAVEDIVLCKVGGTQYLHLIRAIRGGRFLIGNNRGRLNGWIGPGSIFGKCVRVE